MQIQNSWRCVFFSSSVATLYLAIASFVLAPWLPDDSRSLSGKTKRMDSSSRRSMLASSQHEEGEGQQTAGPSTATASSSADSLAKPLASLNLGVGEGSTEPQQGEASSTSAHDQLSPATPVPASAQLWAQPEQAQPDPSQTAAAAEAAAHQQRIPLSTNTSSSSVLTSSTSPASSPSAASSLTTPASTPSSAAISPFEIQTGSSKSTLGIKCRDFASSTRATATPARPPPTVLAQINTATHDPSSIRGMASAPAVQTLAGTSRSMDQPEPPSRPAPTSAGPSPSLTPVAGPSFRKPGTPGPSLAARIPPSLQAKMAAMASRSNNPTSMPGSGQSNGSSVFKTPAPPGGLHGRPSPAPMGATGRVGAMGPIAGRGPMSTPGMGGLGKRRGPMGGLSLAQMGGSGSEASGPGANGLGGRRGPGMQLPGGAGSPSNQPKAGGAFANFSKIVDPSGSLNFDNKAVLHAKGVDFSNGSSFAINMDELELQEELGSGNYGTVKKVYHRVTKVTMAMKEIRLELDDSKLKGMLTELDVLHRAVAPEIVDFYGAFFIESCVYYCLEYMDAGSLDKLAGYPVPENVLKRVTASTVRGLKFLKDNLQIMHRDVKPTNILMNTAGAVKLCDFGVSGQLERSLAKTNIGCQSYMAPERIQGGATMNFMGTYTVSSDVWSLGLSLIEFACGHYPYPPETYNNVFAQLQEIVNGAPPRLPDGYSDDAQAFTAACLHKDANKRPSYAQMLESPFLIDEPKLDIDMAGWVREALDYRKTKKQPS